MTIKPDLYPGRILLPVCCLLLGACSSVSYYGQTISGHLDVIESRRPVHEVIEDESTAPEVRKKLEFIVQVLEFAHERLGLPDNGSYHHYADLDRPYVAWNIFAAPELSLEPRRWCYLLVGCFSYRGYFDREKALSHASRLREEGWDTYAGGVRAYSTLGWFRDPVLNTMLDQDNWELARLVFHELAHQKLYIPDAIDLNEAFAESVARIGLERWLANRPAGEAAKVRQTLAFEDAFFNLLLEYKNRLRQLYHSDLPRPAILARKQATLDQLVQDYGDLKRHQGGGDRFDRWMSTDLNNGKLVAVATYRRLMPEIMAIYASTGEDLAGFYDYIAGLRDCGKAPRRARLREYRPDKAC